MSTPDRAALQGCALVVYDDPREIDSQGGPEQAIQGPKRRSVDEQGDTWGAKSSIGVSPWGPHMAGVFRLAGRPFPISGLKSNIFC